MGLDLPPYDFREDKSFERAKQELSWPDKELDEHIHAIQLAIGNRPFEEPWSVAMLSNQNSDCSLKRHFAQSEGDPRDLPRRGQHHLLHDVQERDRP